MSSIYFEPVILIAWLFATAKPEFLLLDIKITSGCSLIINWLVPSVDALSTITISHEQSGGLLCIESIHSLRYLRLLKATMLILRSLIAVLLSAYGTKLPEYIQYILSYYFTKNQMIISLWLNYLPYEYIYCSKKRFLVKIISCLIYSLWMLMEGTRPISLRT